jgi:hypothetical protein
MLRLGFFPAFLGLSSNAVLIAADSDDIKSLYGAISRLSEAPAESLAIHEIAQVSRKHSVRLFVTARQPISSNTASSIYYWVLPEPARIAAVEMLVPLTKGSACHQYFDLAPDSASLVVSVGEYDAKWWQRIDD